MCEVLCVASGLEGLGRNSNTGHPPNATPSPSPPPTPPRQQNKPKAEAASLTPLPPHPHPLQPHPDPLHPPPTYQIGVEHAPQQLLALWEGPEDLTAGEGAVQEHATPVMGGWLGWAGGLGGRMGWMGWVGGWVGWIGWVGGWVDGWMGARGGLGGRMGWWRVRRRAFGVLIRFRCVPIKPDHTRSTQITPDHTKSHPGLDSTQHPPPPSPPQRQISAAGPRPTART